MTMQSSNLLPELRKLPSTKSSQSKSFRDTISDLQGMDRTLYASEAAAATSFAMWGIFDTINVDDNLRAKITEAHERAFGNYDGTVTDHWQDMLQQGQDSTEGFLNALKGKVAEIDTKNMLEERGYTDVEIAQNPNQPVWDVSATSPDGEPSLWQVKTGNANYSGDVEPLMQGNPDISYAVSTEIYDKISEQSPDLIDQMTDIGFDYDRVEGIKGGLETLSDNMGLDLPDNIGEIVPYAGAIIVSARLIYDVIRTEKKFSTVDRTTKNKIQIVQALTIMSRFGVSTVLSTVGGLGGGAIGSAVPGIGNLIGGIFGTVAGAGMGIYLNKHLQPYMLDLALDITGFEHADLFYFRNKDHIDQIALSFQKNAGLLGTGPHLGQ